MDFFKKVGEHVEGLSQQVENAFGGKEEQQHSESHGGGSHSYHAQQTANNRYQSFAPESSGNAKWYVDGASYFWAVSQAIERKSQQPSLLAVIQKRLSDAW
jgi:phospholipase D1/2